jgi:UPF0716 protein FxsA|tara:strand:+ start:42 stop:461 length:420 start_codon:yes stop_codon:yes gene_type:complete
MNSLLLIIIGIPVIEIFLMIKVGQYVGALNTILLIFLTAAVGVYFAKIQGLSTIRSGITNIYQNKAPLYEILSGASIAFAAFLLIFPGFLTDIIGFIILVPFSRAILIKIFINKNYKNKTKNSNIIDGEIIDKKDDDEL